MGGKAKKKPAKGNKDDNYKAADGKRASTSQEPDVLHIPTMGAGGGFSIN